MIQPARLAAPVLILGGMLLSASLSGCATLGTSDRSLVPTRYQTRTGPYVVSTNQPLSADAPALRQLQLLERQMETKLGVRVDPAVDPIEIYILDDRTSFEHFLKFYYPELPTRRAFFLAQGTRRVVYTYQGDHLEEDLRHEATHALLHASASDLPLWLDEGLAEYFEVPARENGVNAEHLARLPRDLADGWRPDLLRLENLKDVRQMSPRDYRESWAWAHYLLNGSQNGRATLLGYLADLRSGASTVPLSARLGADPDAPVAQMIAHLEHARERPLAATAPAPIAVMRLQNVPPPRRRGLLGRLRDLFSPQRDE